MVEVKDYLEYARERLGQEGIASPYGWITYNVWHEDGICHIWDMYISQEARREGHASKLADMVADIALQADCHTLQCTVYPKAYNSTDSIQAIIRYGFKLYDIGNDRLIYLRKKIGESDGQ